MNNGWYVRSILLHIDSIRSSVFGPDVSEDIAFYNFEEDEYDYIFSLDLDNDLYSDLLSIEIKIKSFESKGLFSDRERIIVYLLLQGYALQYIADTMKVSTLTILNDLNSISERLAFALGDHFTNEGYLNYMAKKYKLEDSEIDRIQSIMER